MGAKSLQRRFSGVCALLIAKNRLAPDLQLGPNQASNSKTPKTATPCVVSSWFRDGWLDGCAETVRVGRPSSMAHLIAVQACGDGVVCRFF